MADNQAQERDKDVVVYSAFGGLRNDVTAERFGIGDLEVATNCDLDKTGRLSRRAGYTSVAAGMRHSLWANETQTVCLFVEGNALKRMFADYSSTTLRTLTGIGARMSYTEVNGRVYFSNGIDIGIVQDGVARSWGLSVPALPGVTVGAGNMPAGRYQFVVTHLREDGQESGAPMAGVVDVPVNSALAFSIPASHDPSVAAKAIYISTPNGDTMFEAGAVANATTTWAYAGDTTELTTPLDTQFMGPPPAGQVVAYYRGRMWVAAGDVIYPSGEYAYERFDLRRGMSVDGMVTLLAPMEDKESANAVSKSGFFMGTDKSCGAIVGAGPEDFQYIPKTSYGAILGALDYVDGSVFGDNSLGARKLPMWLTAQGICVGKPEMMIQNITRTKYSFTAAGQGAAIFMPGPNRFIVTSNS